MATLLFSSLKTYIVFQRAKPRPTESWWPLAFKFAHGTISLAEWTVRQILLRPRCALAITGTFLTLKILETAYSKNRIRYYLSHVLEQGALVPIISSEHARSQFRSAELPTAHVVSNHTHGVAAAHRTSASNFIDHYAGLLGTTPYFIQMSAADLRRYRSGCRDWHWAKDVGVTPSAERLHAGQIVGIVDVCYYMDMPKQLANNFQHHLMYAFQPGSVSRATGDYTFFFDTNGSVRYTVSGGAEYNHFVHNYGVDTIKARTTWFGITQTVAVYTMERKQVDDDHQIVLAAATKKWTGWRAILAHYLLASDVIRYIDVRDGDYARVNVVKPSGMHVSTGYIGSYGSIEIPAHLDTALKMKAMTSKNGLTLSMVSATLNLQVDDPMATLLHNYHSNKIKHGRAHYVFPVDGAVERYQFGPKNWDPDARETLQAFMNPMDDNAFAPDKCSNNEKRAILKRITEAKSQAQSSPKHQLYVSELISLLCPPHVLRPVDETTVFEIQARPEQQRTLYEATMLIARLVTQKVKSFMKCEATQKLSDPRMISTVDPHTKLHYSMFTYALADQLKQFPFYAFGKTPLGVAERVTELCVEAVDSILKTDFKRFDGHVAPALRQAEQKFLLHCFMPEYANRILDLHNTVQQKKAKSFYGEVYQTGTSRLSGGPDTSILNTFCNIVIAFCALRETKNEEGYYNSAIEAFAKLGVYGGDDGLTSGIKPSKYIDTALKFGQILEVEEVSRGDLGVAFLAREYSHFVWHGSTNSQCDLKRQLSKFHTTRPLPKSITPLMKFEEKIASYYLTDKWTPIIGDLARKWKQLRHNNEAAGHTTRYLNIWQSEVAEDVHYPNECEDWMLANAHKIYGADRVAMFEEWLDTVVSVEDLLSPPLLRERVRPESADAVVWLIDSIVPAIGKGKTKVEPVRIPISARAYEAAKLAIKDLAAETTVTPEQVKPAGATPATPAAPKGAAAKAAAPKGAGRGRGGKGDKRSREWSAPVVTFADAQDAPAQPSKGRGRGKGKGRGTGKGRGQ